MRTLLLHPYKIENHIRDCDVLYIDQIIVGKCNHRFQFFSKLFFKPIALNHNEHIVKALLRMYCSKACYPHEALSICVGDSTCSLVSDRGIYEWDITNLVKYHSSSDFDLPIYGKDNPNHCGLKEFDALGYILKPVLELTIENKNPQPQPQITNIVTEYRATDILTYTDWIDCSAFRQYYFFIKNFGASSVEVFIEISPDRDITYQDSDTLLIKNNSVIYLIPLRESQFVRIAYKNNLVNKDNLIKVHFQGKS